MTVDEIKESNTLIVDFLDWEWHKSCNGDVVWMPDIYFDGTISKSVTTRHISECKFDTDWNWNLYLFNEVHRKVCIPIIRDNKHLRSLRKLVQETKKAIVWYHIEDSYKLQVKIIEFYNQQFNK
jgi:hypothetical protein